jgi:GntR family transcriptional regulator
MQMLRDKAIPLYYQLETILRRKILSGDYKPDKPLPSEDMLAEEYQVSRITVRQALASLEQDGLVLRQRGKGTFVSEKVSDFRLPLFTGSIEDLVLMGIHTDTEVLSSDWIDAPENIREKLQAISEKVLRIEKIRSIEGSPFSHVFNYLPHDIGQEVPAELVTQKPMLMILEDELGIRATQAEQSVEATIADAEVASMLEIRVGDPLLKVERTVYDHKDRPVEYVSVLYRADKYAFTVKLKRRRRGDSVGWGAV